MKISYIILTCNRWDTLMYHIRSIRLQDYLCNDLEIIVADDGSIDWNTDELCWRNGTIVKYVNTESYNKSTPAKARNMGINVATGDLLIFADDDCLPHPLLLQEYQKLERGKCGVGYRSSLKDRLAIDLSRFDYLKDIEAGNPTAYFQRQQNGVFGYIHFASGSFAIWREDLGDVRFDEEFEGYGYEDRHFAFLLHQKGITFEFMPKAIIYHDNRAGNRLREQKDSERLINREIYDRKIKS
jgi:GT2 family glycosyltransferase